MVSLPATPTVPVGLLDDDVPPSFIDLDAPVDETNVVEAPKEAGGAATESTVSGEDSAAIDADSAAPPIVSQAGGEEAVAPTEEA